MFFSSQIPVSSWTQTGSSLIDQNSFLASFSAETCWLLLTLPCGFRLLQLGDSSSCCCLHLLLWHEDLLIASSMHGSTANVPSGNSPIQFWCGAADQTSHEECLRRAWNCQTQSLDLTWSPRHASTQTTSYDLCPLGISSFFRMNPSASCCEVPSLFFFKSDYGIGPDHAIALIVNTRCLVEQFVCRFVFCYEVFVSSWCPWALFHWRRLVWFRQDCAFRLHLFLFLCHLRQRLHQHPTCLSRSPELASCTIQCSTILLKDVLLEVCAS